MTVSDVTSAEATGELSATERREIISAALTLGAAIGLFGIVFGVGVVAAGGSVSQAIVMSVLVFTGASQFSLVSEVASGSSGISALGGAILLAGRNTVYGLAMSRVVTGSFGKRMLAAQWTIDETTAMATAQPTPAGRRLAFWVTGAAAFVCWNVATIVGALVGSSINVETWGLDVAFPAGFVAMVMPHLRTRRGLIAGLLGAAICLILVPFTPAGVPVLGAAAAVLIGLRAPEPHESGSHETGMVTA